MWNILIHPRCRLRSGLKPLFSSRTLIWTGLRYSERSVMSLSRAAPFMSLTMTRLVPTFSAEWFPRVMLPTRGIFANMHLEQAWFTIRLWLIARM